MENSGTEATFGTLRAFGLSGLWLCPFIG
uniref:Uncharacterized protein n=1 Tax=Anguilla anguilla TaxID=7936 RepID=A0A0E9QC20_ANGAN